MEIAEYGYYGANEPFHFPVSKGVINFSCKIHPKEGRTIVCGLLQHNVEASNVGSLIDVCSHGI